MYEKRHIILKFIFLELINYVNMLLAYYILIHLKLEFGVVLNI